MNVSNIAFKGGVGLVGIGATTKAFAGGDSWQSWSIWDPDRWAELLMG